MSNYNKRRNKRLKDGGAVVKWKSDQGDLDRARRASPGEDIRLTPGGLLVTGIEEFAKLYWDARTRLTIAEYERNWDKFH